MISIDTLIVTIDGLDRDEVENWIAQDWLRPVQDEGIWHFADIDVARLHLILDLRTDFQIDDHGMPMVLHLLDQLYDARRQLRRLGDAITLAPMDIREAILQAMTETLPVRAD